jgi:hypothetical protein
MRAIGISGAPSLFGFTRYEWRVFFVVWLGWALDATDFNLFSLVLKPAVTEILGGTGSPPTLASGVVYWPWSASWAGRWAACYSASSQT